MLYFINYLLLFKLSNSAIDENTDNYTFVGFLQTMDDDQNQTFVYTLLDSANGLFTLAHNNRLLVSAVAVNSFLLLSIFLSLYNNRPEFSYSDFFHI